LLVMDTLSVHGESVQDESVQDESVTTNRRGRRRPFSPAFGGGSGQVRDEREIQKKHYCTETNKEEKED